jgi:outer membrane receptor for ferrienterochelin and colicin
MYWENIDKAVTEGVEISLAGELTKTTTVRANYTFLHTIDKDLEKELTARPKHKASVELNQKFPDIGLSINIAGQYIGRRYDSDYKRLGGYTQCDIAATQELGKNVQLFAKVENVLDKKRVADEYDIDGTRFLAGLKIVF